MLTAKATYLLAAMASGTTGVIAGRVVPEVEAQLTVEHFLQVSVPLPILLVGLGMSIAGGFIGMAISPPNDRFSTKLLTLVVALAFGLLAAMAHPAIPFVKAFPEQAVMFIAGMSSRMSALLAVKLQVPFLKNWGAK